MLVYAEDVNILERSLHTIRVTVGALVVASKESGLEINADKTKYMVMSRGQNAGRNHIMMIDNSFYEMVEEYKYLETNLTNHTYIQEEIKNRLKSENACYNSVQNPLSSSLLSKNLKIKMYRSLIFPVVLYGCETWSLTLKEKRRLRVSENRALRRIFGQKRCEKMGEGENYIMRSLMICTPHSIFCGC